MLSPAGKQPWPRDRSEKFLREGVIDAPLNLPFTPVATWTSAPCDADRFVGDSA